MARKCTVCIHPKRAEIDKLLAAGSESNRRVASQFGLVAKSVDRHAASHLPARVQAAVERKQIALDAPLADQVNWYQEQARECLFRAMDADDLSNAGTHIARGLECLNMLAKLTGSYAPQKHQHSILDLRKLTPEQHIGELEKMRADVDAEIARLRELQVEREKVLS